MADIKAVLGNLLGDLVAPRPAYQFSRGDETYRNDLYAAMTPEQRTSIDQAQNQMWHNDFDRSLPLARPMTWSSVQSNMPIVDRFQYGGRDMPAAMPQPVDSYNRQFHVIGNAQYPTIEMDTGAKQYQFGLGAPSDWEGQ